MSKVKIMRGVPGSGKSTEANWIARIFAQAFLGRESVDTWMEDCVRYYGERTVSGQVTRLVAIHSTDEYFMDENGNYNWSQSLIHKNHSKNYEAFRNSIDQSIPLVIVDNTNTTAKEYIKYKNYAEKNGCRVSFIVMPHPTVADAVQRNSHNVPADVIKKMIARFE